MDFRQFQYILKVAQVGNITKAAEELYMTQSALSHYIAKVEKEEGIRIFDRSTTPITLTYAGERYVAAIRKIMELGDQLHEELLELSTHKRGKLTIGIPPVRAAKMLPRFLPEYVRRYPQVQLHTIEHNSRQLTEDVDRGRADFAILPLLEELEGYRCVGLFKEELLLVTQKGILPESAYHIGSDGRRVVDLANLRDRTFILLKRGHGSRNALDPIFEYNGFKPKLFIETTNSETAYRLAATGLGIAVVPQMNVDPFQESNPVDIYRLSDSGLKWTVTAIFNTEKSVPYFAAKCVEVIQEIYNGRAIRTDL